MIVGDYRYGSCVLDGVRYAIIKNYNIIQCVRRVGKKRNPVIWEKGDLLTEISIIWNATYEVTEQPLSPSVPLSSIGVAP